MRYLSTKLIALTLLAAAALASGVASAAPPNMPIYGPARNRTLSGKNTYGLAVYPGETLILEFSQDAWFENAVCVYDETGQLRAYRNNYERLTTFKHKNNTGVTEVFYVSGWHKPSPPKASMPWLRSDYKWSSWKWSSSQKKYYAYLRYEDSPSGPGEGVTAVGSVNAVHKAEPDASAID